MEIKHSSKVSRRSQANLCMIKKGVDAKCKMQKGISEKGQQCLKKAFNVVP
jgi:hypothetical protein